MGDTVGMGVNEGDYNGELRLTRNSLTWPVFSIVTTGGGADASNHEGCNRGLLARKATSRRPTADLLHMLDIICAGGRIGIGEGTVQERVGEDKPLII